MKLNLCVNEWLNSVCFLSRSNWGTCTPTQGLHHGKTSSSEPTDHIQDRLKGPFQDGEERKAQQLCKRQKANQSTLKQLTTPKRYEDETDSMTKMVEYIKKKCMLLRKYLALKYLTITGENKQAKQLLTPGKNTSDRRGRVGTEYHKTYNSHNNASTEHQ